MSERFEMCAGERIGMIVIKDNQTKETGLGFFKSRDDLSFFGSAQRRCTGITRCIKG